MMSLDNPCQFAGPIRLDQACSDRVVSGPGSTKISLKASKQITINIIIEEANG